MLLLEIDDGGRERSSGGLPGQLKIPIGRDVIPSECDMPSAVRVRDDQDFMIRRIDFSQRKAGGKIDGQAHRIDGAAMRGLYGRGDP